MSLPTIGQGTFLCATSITHVEDDMRMSFKAARGEKFAFLMLGAVKKSCTVTERHLMAVMSKFGYLVPKDAERWSDRIEYLQNTLKKAGIDFVSEDDWLEEGRRLVEAERADARGSSTAA